MAGLGAAGCSSPAARPWVKNMAATISHRSAEFFFMFSPLLFFGDCTLRNARHRVRSYTLHLPLLRCHHQPEPDVRHRVVGIVAAPRARPVTQAVVDIAEKGSAARDAARSPHWRAAILGIEAVSGTRRILHRAAALLLARQDLEVVE